MASETLGEVIRRLGRSGGLQGDLAQTDDQLLERFARRRDEPAFAALLARHGPMVLGVCRRLLRDSQEAEDAFQAAFLVLARKAGAIQRQSLIGPWLYGVAWRVAGRLRCQAAGRRARESASVDLNGLPADEEACSEDRWVVHEEVQRLPEVYRSAVVLCFLEGKTNEEAARLLRRPVGTVKSRLTRARDLLRTRLTRRGMALGGGGVVAAIRANASPASAALVDTTIRAALPFAAGEAVGAPCSARAVALSQGVLQAMLLTKLKITAALILALVVLGAGGNLAYRAWASEPASAPKVVVVPEKPAPALENKPKEDAEAIQGTWVAVSAEADGTAAPAEAIKDFELLITADKLVFNPKGENRESTYTLDAAKTPKVIEVKPQDGPGKGKTSHGLYELDGDHLKLCLQNSEGKEPTEFATKAGSGLRLLILKRKPADKPKEDKEAIQGTWRVIGFETEGMKRDDDNARQVKSQKWVFSADKLVVHADAPGGGEQEVEIAIHLDASKTPKEIDLGKGRKAVYSLDGDRLKICHSLSGPELKQWDQLTGRRARGIEVGDVIGRGRPSAVTTKEGSETTLITLERVK